MSVGECGAARDSFKGTLSHRGSDLVGTLPTGHAIAFELRAPLPVILCSAAAVKGPSPASLSLFFSFSRLLSMILSSMDFAFLTVALRFSFLTVICAGILFPSFYTIDVAFARNAFFPVFFFPSVVVVFPRLLLLAVVGETLRSMPSRPGVLL